MRHKKPLKLNIGLIVFIAILIYLIVNTVMYLQRKHVAYFEAEAGKIVESDSFTGIILRDERVVGASNGGYINYYVKDGRRIGKGGYVCMLTSDTRADSPESENTYRADASDLSDIRSAVSEFRSNYSDSNYQEVLSLDYKLNNIVSSIVSKSNIDQAEAQVNARDITVMAASDAGVISCTWDNMESITREDICQQLFDSQRSYERHQIAAGTHLDAGSPAYKIVDSEAWEIIINPNNDQLSRIEAAGYVKLYLIRENVTLTVEAESFISGNNTYVALKLSSYMIKYLNDRFIDVEIVWNSEEGIKIPVSSIVEKSFYVIPNTFIIRDDEGNAMGFSVLTEDGAQLVDATIYKQDETNSYVDPSQFEPEATLVTASGNERYTVVQTQNLKGVYCINRGYAVFRLINILYTNGQYCIVENGTDYGISLYDHVVLDGTSIKENETI